ncbi:MAG: dihydrofolate reductase, partial [Verrucomicrobiota bacterium]
MEVTLVSAVAANGTIGTGNGIPWELPRDSQHFRKTVSNHVILLGRRTFEEMIGWYRTERPVVMTRDAAWEHEEAFAVVSSVEEACRVSADAGEANLMVCGGASIYAAALPVATRLILTHLGAEVDGKAVFPEVNAKEWRRIHEVNRGKLMGHDYPIRFSWYERREAPGAATLS